MSDLTNQLNLDQYMVSNASPLNHPGVTPIGVDYQLDNSVGAASFATGRVNTPITIGGLYGAAYLRLDGQNNRIVSNDGTNNRIVIGSI